MDDQAKAERAYKAQLSLELKEMKAGRAYQAVLARIMDRCGSGKWWKAWVLADDAKAKLLRDLARGYLAFDELVEQMIHEGATASKILQGDEAKSSPGQETGQGA